MIANDRKQVAVRRKSHLLAATVACGAFLLASCGDDDPAPTPSPTASPTPSPSPTPTPAATDFDFTQAFEASVNNTSYIYAYFTPDGGSETWNGGSTRNGQSQISYAVSPDSVSFTFPDTSTVRSFAAADLETASPTLRTYRKGTEAIALELPFEHVLRVSYERVDPFVRETVDGDLRSNRVSIFFNTVSTTSEITSNLSYTGSATVVGGKPGTTAPGTYSSPATTLTVAASDKKITGTIRLLSLAGGVSTVIADIPISAAIASGNVFNGTIDTGGFKGTYVGALAGPAREEVFLIFNIRHTDGRELLGSLIGD